MNQVVLHRPGQENGLPTVTQCPPQEDCDMPAAPSHSTTGPSLAPDDRRQGLGSPSFIGLLITQFLGAMNDNMFRWLVVPIGYELLGKQAATTVVSVGALMLMLPFILFAAPAGFLADRFAKNQVIVGCKVLEVVVMLAGVFGILTGNIYVMFGVLFCMGTQSALFGPAKYGSIPEIVRPDRIPVANGLMGLTTIIAIVAGTVAGGALYDMATPMGRSQWWIWAAAIVGTATVGTLFSLLIRPLQPASPERRVPWNPARETWRDLRLLIGVRALFLAAVGSALFWSIAGLFQLNTDRFADQVLHIVSRSDVGWLLAAPVVGVGLGNLLAGLLSAGRIELGMVPFATAGLAVSSILLFFVPGGDGTTTSVGYILSTIFLFMVGVSAGMYDVPLQSFLQYRSSAKNRGAILASASLLSFSGMILATGVFWVLDVVIGLSYAGIFLLVGLAVVPVLVAAVYLLPMQTTRFAAWCVSRMIYRVRVEGLENLPAEGGALLASNHVSWVDGPLLGLSLPRDIRMIAYADYFENGWLRWFGNVTRIIPIRPGKRQIVEAIREAREALKQDELVGIFPEGGLTRSGETEEFQPGFLTILKDTDKPVIPVHLVGLWGSVFSFERGRFFWKWPRQWRYPVTIRFGEPIYAPKDAEQVRQAVIALGQAASAG